jgi:hypothetical protein
MPALFGHTRVKPMPSFKTTAIATAFSLALIFGLLWWDGRSAQTAGRQAAISVRPSIGGVEAAQFHGSEPISSSPTMPKTVRKPSDDPQAAAVPAAPALPLVIRFSHRIHDPDRRIEGSIENVSESDVSITLSVMGGQTQTVSRSTLAVPSQSRIVFGRDDGLNLASGDQITLASPTYSDLSQQVP